MGATRDFVSATVADALLPAFRRPVEDIIYETLDRRQVPTRTDFKEMRDLLNNLRGQVSGTSNGIRKVVERAEETEDLIDQLEAKLSSIEGRFAALADVADAAARFEERISKVEREHVTLARFSATISAIQASFPPAVTPEQLAEAIAALKADIPAPQPAVTPEQLAEAIAALKADIREPAVRATAAAVTASMATAKGPVATQGEDICKVPGCTQKARARGFCARHYQRWRRGTLKANFVSLDGNIQIGEQTVKVDANHIGAAFRLKDGGVYIGDKRVATVES